MEQELTIIKFIIYGMVGISGVFIIIFSLRKNDSDNDNSFDWATVDKWYKIMQEETKDNLDTLNKLNKEKDRLEKQIRKKKKILGKRID